MKHYTPDYAVNAGQMSSVFGKTEKVVQAIGQAIATVFGVDNHVETLTVSQVPAFDSRVWLETIVLLIFCIIIDKGGYAANTITSALTKNDGSLLMQPEGFLVTGEQGPLKEGELKRT